VIDRTNRHHKSLAPDRRRGLAVLVLLLAAAASCADPGQVDALKKLGARIAFDD
jgi:hypothetical protein